MNDTAPADLAEPTAKRRKNDPEGLRQRILDAALVEFSTMGLSGARLDSIAERADTNKRMVVYYFRSKEGLYVAVLERVYGEIRDVERDLHLDDLPPEEAITRLVEFTFDYHGSHPEFNRLVSIENIHYAKYIEQSKSIRSRNRSVIEVLEKTLTRGCETGVFRCGLDALDVHMMISALCFFRVSNRHTFAVLFGKDLASDESRRRHRRMVVEAVLSYLKAASR